MSGPGVVIFSADFRGADQTTFTKRVAVAAIGTDLDGVGGSGKNFWVEGEGFGTAFDARFP